jgi:hypothetical protein
MAANLRSLLASYRGDIKFPLSGANLPDKNDPASIVQLRLDMFGDTSDPKMVVKSGDWLVGRQDTER